MEVTCMSAETQTSQTGTKTGTKVTTDHKEIRRWAEEHGGKPARVKGTGNDDPGIRR
jgi:hypothetical protein